LLILGIIIYIFFNDPEEKIRKAVIVRSDQFGSTDHRPQCPMPLSPTMPSCDFDPEDLMDPTSSITLSNTINNSVSSAKSSMVLAPKSRKSTGKKVRFNDVVDYNVFDTNSDVLSSASQNPPSKIQPRMPSQLQTLSDNSSEEKWDSVFTRKLNGGAQWNPAAYVPCLNPFQVDPKTTIIDPSMVLQKIDITRDRIQGSKDKMGMKIKDIFDQQTANTKAVPKQLSQCSDCSWKYVDESELNGGMLRNSYNLTGYSNPNFAGNPLEDFFQGITYKNAFDTN
jgi:hypothetical protein